jgi:hypothetical protein
VARQPASQRRGDAYVEDVGQRGRIPARAKEIREKTSREPNPTRRTELHEELYTRADAWKGDREGIVDLERAEDKEPTAPTAPDLVGDDLTGVEARDRTERPLA